jgi:signal transduction histidine kinase
MNGQCPTPGNPAATAPTPRSLQAANGDRPRPARAQAPPESTGLRQRVPAAIEERERFAAFVAHELRTPLATQRALLELALADPAADTATWRELGQDVLRACEQQEHLLEACLTLARSQGRLRRRETIDLGRIISTVVQDHDLQTLTPRLRLERALISGDPDLIERLVANLVGNAVRHNQDGGWIRVATSSTATRALVTIENTGKPIRPGEATRLFEPFQQLGSRTDAQGGLGLGLVVVKAVADAHGAVISATARAAGGLRVEVAFPASAARDPGRQSRS